MDDLNATINSILGDPQKMEQLRQVAQSLGMNPPPPPAQGQSQGQTQANQPPAQGGAFDPSALASILQGFQGGGNSGNSGGNNTNGGNAPAGGASMPNLGAISKISEIMGTFNQSDKNVDLLRSLKPHFSSSRAGRIDDAVRIMQLLRAWPSLRDSGLLGSIGNLFSGGSGK